MHKLATFAFFLSCCLSAETRAGDPQTTAVVASGGKPAQDSRAPAPSAEEMALGDLAVRHAAARDHVGQIRTNQQLLLLQEDRYGTDSPQVAVTLRLLAGSYELIDREDLAAPLRARADAIERAPGHIPLPAPDNPYALAASIYDRLLADDGPAAERMARQALAALRPASGYGPSERDTIRLYLGDALRKQGRFADAEAEYADIARSADAERRIAAELRTFLLYAAQDRRAEAERKIAVAAALIDAQGRAPDADESLQIGDYYRHHGRHREALEWKLRSMQALSRRYTPSEPDAWGVRLATQRGDRWRFMDFLATTAEGFDAVHMDLRLMSASFEVAQLAQASGVGLSIAQMALRHAEAGDGFASMLREQQDERARLAADDQALARLIGERQRDPDALANLRQRIAAREAGIAARERELAAKFPRAQAITSQAPLATSELDPLLRAHEALVVFLVDDHTTYAWVANKDSGQIGYMTLPVPRETLEREVASLRGKLTSGESGMPPREMQPEDGMRLYDILFKPLQPWLRDVAHILLVADASLQSLPFAALGDGAGAAPDWLGKRHAFSLLPSVASLRALRGTIAPRKADLSFAGFGDPILGAKDTAVRSLPMRGLYRAAPGASLGGSLVDPGMLRTLAPLQDTAIELRAIARVLGTSDDALHLREQATETQVKRLPLDRYRILSFATHGIMAGELTEGVEPGLILTPPDAPTQLDDGYLTASEAAQLKLDADWVLLSACNTAASDGTPDAEGLSGLANGFLYAGARALLVSHWRVSSEATTKLVAETVAAYAKSPQAGKAMALRAAMLAMMDKPEYAHPYYWAAFSVIGD